MFVGTVLMHRPHRQQCINIYHHYLECQKVRRSQRRLVKGHRKANKGISFQNESVDYYRHLLEKRA